MRILLLLILGLISLEARSTFERQALACTKRVQKMCDLRCSNGCLNKNRRKPGRRMSKRAKQKYCSRVFSMWCKRVQKMCSLRCSNGCLNENRRKPGRRMSTREKQKYCSKVSCMSETSAS